MNIQLQVMKELNSIAPSYPVLQALIILGDIKQTLNYRISERARKGFVKGGKMHKGNPAEKEKLEKDLVYVDGLIKWAREVEKKGGLDAIFPPLTERKHWQTDNKCNYPIDKCTCHHNKKYFKTYLQKNGKSKN